VSLKWGLTVYMIVCFFSIVSLFSFVAWLSPCQIQRRQALGLRGVPVVGLHLPECKEDGGYSAVQCHMTSGYCWCVDELGNEVQGSRKNGRPSCGEIFTERNKQRS